MCKDGHKEIAWFLVLIPFILLFLLMGSMMGGSSYEGFEDACDDGMMMNPAFDSSLPESDSNMRCIVKEGFRRK